MATAGQPASAGDSLPAPVLLFPQETRTGSEFDCAVLAQARHYARLAEREGPRLRGAGTDDAGRAQIRALKRFGSEAANMMEASANAINYGLRELILPLTQYFPAYLEIAGEFREQRHQAQELLAGALRLDDEELVMLARLALCRARLRIGLYPEAEAEALTVIDMAARRNDRRTLAAALIARGTAYLMRGDYHAACEQYEKALEHHGSEEPSARATALNNLGLAHYAQGDQKAARAAYIEALALARAVGNVNQAANTLSNLAQVHEISGDRETARLMHEEALAARLELGAKLGIASSYGYLGAIKEALDSPAAALADYRASLQLMQELGNQHTVAWALGNLGVAECGCGHFAMGHARIQEALRLQQGIGDRHGSAETLQRLAWVNLDIGHLATALAHLATAATLQHEIGDKRGLLNTSRDVGRTLIALGREADGLLIQAAALQLADDLGISIDADGIDVRLLTERDEQPATMLALWDQARQLSLAELAELVACNCAAALADTPIP